MAKRSKMTIPVTIAPSGSTNRVIALNQAIESFSYEERNSIKDMVMETWRATEAEHPTHAEDQDDTPETMSKKAFEKYFSDNTELIVDRAKAFAKFLES